MEEEDFRELIGILSRHLEEIGAGDIADDAHYTENAPETGEARVLPQQVRLVLMLEAFERFVAVRDRAAYADALIRVNQSVGGRFPPNVLYEPPLGGRELNPISLAEVPDLSEVRSEIRDLIRGIRDPGDE